MSYRITPVTMDRPDVLVVLGTLPRQRYYESRGHPSVEVLAAHGVRCICVAYENDQSLKEAIRDLKPSMVYIRGMCVQPPLVEYLADSHPSIHFVPVNHSSQADLARGKDWSFLQSSFLEMSNRIDNVTYGHANRDMDWGFFGFLSTKFVPFPIRKIPFKPLPRSLPEVPTLSIISAGRPLKNIQNQIIACGILNRIDPINVLIGANRELGQLEMLANDVGLGQGGGSCSIASLQPWADYIDMIDSQVDIGLQCSFTESFNYISFEHMLLGIPVVSATGVISHASGNEADPNSPGSIVHAVRRIMDNYDRESSIAKSGSEHIAKTQNTEFAVVTQSLLDYDAAYSTL